MRRFHLEHALLPQGLRQNVAVTVTEDGEIRAVGPADPALVIPGTGVPGLVNAHTHLELSGALVPGGQGLPAWVQALYNTPRAAFPAVDGLIETGTFAVGEVTNTRATDVLLGASPLRGRIFHEVLGIDVSADLPPVEPAPAGFTATHVPHAPYSTSAAHIQAALADGGTIHVAEDPAETTFLATGTGPWATFLTRVGRDLSGWVVPGCSPIAYLDRLGVLKPGVGLVHAVHVSSADLDLIAASGATVVLCPRSNLHIGGQLPDVPPMIERGIPLALGTDSRASCPDLDLLADVAVLRRAFPEVSPQVWLQAATAGGAALVGVQAELVPGARCGVLLLEGAPGQVLDHDRIPRRWLASPVPAAAAATTRIRA